MQLYCRIEKERERTREGGGSTIGWERERETQGVWKERAWKLLLWLSRREKKESDEGREKRRKKGFFMKGDNKEPLKEQMKMSFLHHHPPVPPSPLSCGGIMRGEREKVRENECFSTWDLLSKHLHTPFLPWLFSLFLVPWHLSSSTYLLLPSPPHHPFPFAGCDYFPDKDVSSTTHANPSKLTFFFFLCLHSIILDINSRLLSNRKIWIGPQLSLCPSFQPIERSVIMVIGHSLILELLFLF